MSRYDLPDPLCRHEPLGTVSWPSPWEPSRTRPHAGIAVCGRAECQDVAAEWVKAHTGHRGVFATFEENRARRAESGATS